MLKKLCILFASLLCSISFAQSGMTNLDFENWVTTPTVCPSGFIGKGVSQQTTGALSGASYARIETTVSTGSGATGVMIVSSGGSNGTPYANMLASISGYYRCNMAGSDTMGMSIALFKSHALIANGGTYITAAQTAWTPITLTFNYTNMVTPDTIAFWMIANFGTLGSTPAATVGSYLDVDKFQVNLLVGIDSFAEGEHRTIVFPNPAAGEVHINTSEKNASVVDVHDITGAFLETKTLTDGSTVIDTEKYDNGIYFYSVYDVNGKIIGRDKFIVAR